MASKMRFCPSCGEESVPGKMGCSSCGSTTGRVELVDPEMLRRASTATRDHSALSAGPWTVTIGVVLIALGAGAVGILVGARSAPPPPSAPVERTRSTPIVECPTCTVEQALAAADSRAVHWTCWRRTTGTVGGADIAQESQCYRSLADCRAGWEAADVNAGLNKRRTDVVLQSRCFEATIAACFADGAAKTERCFADFADCEATRKATESASSSCLPTP